jgi:hypothetical protein
MLHEDPGGEDGTRTAASGQDGTRQHLDGFVATAHSSAESPARWREGLMGLREVTAHQDTRKCQTSPHRHIDWADRLETGCLIEPFSVQFRKAMEFAYAKCPGIAETTGKRELPTPRPIHAG